MQQKFLKTAAGHTGQRKITKQLMLSLEPRAKASSTCQRQLGEIIHFCTPFWDAIIQTLE